MKRKAVTPKKASPTRVNPDGFTTLVAEVRSLIQSVRYAAATTVNTLQVLTNFEIDRRIVEYEQKGEKRAEYGKALLKNLSERLTEEFGPGFSRTNLQSMRNFFLAWQDRVPTICQKPSGKSPLLRNGQNPSAKLLSPEILQKPFAQLASPEKSRKPSGELDFIHVPEKLSRKSPFTLSWSHYVLLLTIKDPAERSFYEIETSRDGWSLPELKRQVASGLYERLALSRDKGLNKKEHRCDMQAALF
jgi:hypothetical protein